MELYGDEVYWMALTKVLNVLGQAVLIIMILFIIGVVISEAIKYKDKEK